MNKWQEALFAWLLDISWSSIYSLLGPNNKAWVAIFQKGESYLLLDEDSFVLKILGWFFPKSLAQFSSASQLCPALCNPTHCSRPGLPVHHQFLEFIQTPVDDAIQPSHPLSSPSPPAFSLSQHQSLSQWVSSSHQVAKVLEFQPQHQFFHWTLRLISFRMDWLDQSLGLSRVFSNTTVQKHQFSSA